MEQQTLNGKQKEEYMRFVSVYETDQEILEAINQIYLDGIGFGLDPTYSKGNIYANWQQPYSKFDINPQTPDTKQADCRKLPLKDSSEISIVFDPPFLFRKRKSVNNDKMCDRFSYFKSVEELYEMYRDSLKEFFRVLQDYGILIFKCQDMTDGTFYCTHKSIIDLAEGIGFKLQDIFILVKKNKIIRKSKKQNCTRKIHSYYLVFQRKSRIKEVKPNSSHD
jgi:hypothetical protein